MAPEHQLNVPENVEILEASSNSDTADMSFRYPLSKLIVHQLFANMAHRAPAQLGSARVIFIITLSPRESWKPDMKVVKA